MNFRTTQRFVITRGRDNRRIGATDTIESAEFIGERLRKGTEYTIWKRHDGRWIVYRNRIAG
jgi:hypothetical protein